MPTYSGTYSTLRRAVLSSSTHAFTLAAPAASSLSRTVTSVSPLSQLRRAQAGWGLGESAGSPAGEERRPKLRARRRQPPNP
jgi:hypothetical protein